MIGYSMSYWSVRSDARQKGGQGAAACNGSDLDMTQVAYSEHTTKNKQKKMN